MYRMTHTVTATFNNCALWVIFFTFNLQLFCYIVNFLLVKQSKVCSFLLIEKL